MEGSALRDAGGEALEAGVTTPSSLRNFHGRAFECAAAATHTSVPGRLRRALQAAALGRALTRLCQAATCVAAAGTFSPIQSAKSTVLSAQISAIE